jgi:hypothetical protein
MVSTHDGRLHSNIVVSMVSTLVCMHYLTLESFGYGPPNLVTGAAKNAITHSWIKNAMRRGYMKKQKKVQLVLYRCNVILIMWHLHVKACVCLKGKVACN